MKGGVGIREGRAWEYFGKNLKVLKEQNKDELNGVSCFEQSDQ